MKKVLLGLLALSSFTMAEGKLFDFENAKPITGKVGFESVIGSHFNIKNDSNGPTDIGGKITLESKIYDFADLSAKVSRKASIEHTLKDNGNITQGSVDSEDFLKLGLDFKQFGTPSVKLNDFSKIVLGYKNKAKVYGVGIEGESNLKIDNKFPLDFKLKLDYDVTKDINVYTSGLLQLEFSEKNKKDVKDKYIGADAYGEYALGVKAKLDQFNIEDNLEFKYKRQHYDKLADDSKQYGQDKIEIVNKLAYKLDKKVLGVDKLTVTPKLDTNLGFSLLTDSEKTKLSALELSVKPSVGVNYEIIKNLNATSNVGIQLDYSKLSDNHKLSISPELRLGLNYSF